MGSKIEFLKKMTPDSRSVLEDCIMSKVDSIRFFSYGSNMNEEKFRNDMKNEIGLVNKTRVTLIGFKRTLSNHSEGHGAAFSIRASPGDKVEGICHDVPIELLELFLRKEGVLNWEAPNYRLIKVPIPNQKEPILTLLGFRSVSLDRLSLSKAKKALSYVEESIKGAECNDVEHSDMIEVKRKLLEIIQTKGSTQNNG